MLAIAKRILPVFIRKHENAKISREYRDIKTENVKKYENYLLVLASRWTAQKRVKNGKKG